ncbi:MAG: hypothetical protein ABR593_08670, partial [Candidatus Limnocylindria bacterium]
MGDTVHGGQDEPRHPRPWVAAMLSFLFPGLGQAYSGQRVLAVVLALPVLVVLVAAVFVLNGFAGPLRNSLFSSGFLVAVIVVNLTLFGWRTFAIAHAGLRAPAADHHERRIGLTSVAILVVLTIAMHAWVGIVVAHLDDTLRQVFGGTAVPNVPLP